MNKTKNQLAVRSRANDFLDCVYQGADGRARETMVEMAKYCKCNQAYPCVLRKMSGIIKVTGKNKWIWIAKTAPNLKLAERLVRRAAKYQKQKTKKRKTTKKVVTRKPEAQNRQLELFKPRPSDLSCKTTPDSIIDVLKFILTAVAEKIKRDSKK